ncbi:MAG: O-antigen ligase family protein [Burkholderiales bacterium]|nr:O-antigen ligase family protein [Burkholderiales bacterium]
MSDQVVTVNDRWVFAALLALLFWAPIPLGSNRVLPVGILVLASVLLLLACAWTWRHRVDAAWARLRQFSLPLGLLLAFVGLVWLQTWELPAEVVRALSPEAWQVQHDMNSAYALSLDVNQTRLYAALSVAYACCFVVVVMCVRDKPRLDRLAYWLVLTGVAQAVLAIVLYSVKARYFVFYTEVVHVTTLGTFVNRNHFAGLMELCLGVGVGLMLARLGGVHEVKLNWRERAVYWLQFLLSPKMILRMLLVVMVIALVLTRSRMGNTGFFASLLVVGLIALALTRRSAPAMVTLIVSLILVDIFVVGTWVGLEKVVERAQGPQFGIDVDYRADVAANAVNLVRDFPVVGTGGGSFYNSYIRYRTLLPGFFDHAHHDYLELAGDFGLIGLGLLGALVISTFWVSALNLARRRSSLPRGISFGVMMALAAIAIHSTVDFNLQIPSNALLTVVVLAMGWVAYRLPSGRR